MDYDFFEDDIDLLDESFTYSDILQEADDEDSPMEDDADMDSDGDMGEGDTDSDDEGGDDDMSMDDDSGSDEGGDDSGSDDQGGGMGDDSSVSPTEAIKKSRLFKDYRNLLHSMEDSMDMAEKINYYEMSEDGKKIFNYLEKKISDNHDKMITIMTEQFSKLPYSQLMSMYMYMKIVVKSYTEILVSLFDRTVE
jgi:hypothetical protein